MTSCRYCFGPLFCKGSGRTPVFCSNACKQSNHRLTKAGLHSIAERNRQQSRIKSLRNAAGAASNQEQPLRKAGSFLQVDWTDEN